MIAGEMVDRFSKEGPVCVMVRGTLENVFSGERLDQLFAENAAEQYTSELLFSTVADLMGLVVLKIRPSVHAAFQERAEEVGVSITSVYNKLNGVEPRVCEHLVQKTAATMTAIIDELGPCGEETIPGWELRIGVR